MNASEWDGHLLIVDDEDMILDLIKRQLKDEGYNILTASSGEAALQIMKTHPVAVIVSDQSMPGMDGITFLSKARQMDEDIVLIMLTGNATLGDALEAINQLKIFSYITKPLSASTLRSTIRDAFRHHEMTSVYRVTMKRTYLLNEQLKKENTRLAEQIKELEMKLENSRRVAS